MPHKKIEVSTKMSEGWKVTAQVREHSLVIDQPSGGNEGANHLRPLFSHWLAVFLQSLRWLLESKRLSL